MNVNVNNVNINDDQNIMVVNKDIIGAGEIYNLRVVIAK